MYGSTTATRFRNASVTVFGLLLPLVACSVTIEDENGSPVRGDSRFEGDWSGECVTEDGPTVEFQFSVNTGYDGSNVIEFDDVEVVVDGDVVEGEGYVEASEGESTGSIFIEFGDDGLLRFFDSQAGSADNGCRLDIGPDSHRGDVEVDFDPA